MSAKVAVVAGGGGALGQATAVALSAGGLTVVAVDRNERGLADLPDDIHREVADATDPAAAKRLIDRIADETRPPDVLVNTIGTFRLADALSTTPETLQLMLDVNLGPALWLSQAVAPHMRQQGSGAIVHVTPRPGIEPAGGTRPRRGDRCGDRIPGQRRRSAGERRDTASLRRLTARQSPRSGDDLSPV